MDRPSDRGSQYASSDYRKKLTKYKMTASMSRKGNCYDKDWLLENAVLLLFVAVSLSVISRTTYAVNRRTLKVGSNTFHSQFLSYS